MVMTVKKNYRLPLDLVRWMDSYARRNGITVTALVIRCLLEFRDRR